MRGVVIHAPKDLRVETIAPVSVGPREVLVRIETGGICGSDLHYYHDGGFGTVRIREPMVLGHEIAGTIEEVGRDVAGLAPGQRVAVNPSRPCDQCRYCREGLHNHCLDMRFFGSAMRFPHVQGAFRQTLTVDQRQAIPVAPTLTTAEAAMAEPLAVCLHAVNRAGALMGRKILVTGCGPIGALCVLAARHGGAAEIVATDVSPYPLQAASRMGASRVIDVAREPAALAEYSADKGTFDVLLEASGNQLALRGALDVLRPGAIAVQVGLGGGDMTLPINVIVAKEIQLRGTFRFDDEFRLAVDLMGKGLVDVKPLISATLPFERAVEAFDLASDRGRAMKVQLAF
jgi:L-idonate 5-dehydrogenase